MANKAKPAIIPDYELRRLSLFMASECVRNTVIEEYHGRGSLSQKEMMVFNKQVSNKIYTFLTILLNGNSEQQNILLTLSGMFYPKNWDEPALDGDLAILTDYRKVKAMLSQTIVNNPLAKH